MPPRAAMHDPTLLGVIAATQDDVVTRAQLGVCGYRRRAVLGRVAGRRWQLLPHAIVALHSGPLTERQRQWAAVLAQDAPAALAGLTAAADFGLAGFPADVIHVVVPFTVRPHRLDGVRVHVSRRFDCASEIHPTRTPPTALTSSARAGRRGRLDAEPPGSPAASSPPASTNG